MLASSSSKAYPWSDSFKYLDTWNSNGARSAKKWLREDFKAILMHSDHGNMGGMSWCIVVVKQHPMC